VVPNAPNNQENTEYPKTVIVLGAGASKADGAPLQGELFQEYFASTALRERVDPNMQEGLRKFFKELWGIDVIAADSSYQRFPTFEETLGLLEIAYTRCEFFRGFSSTDVHNTQGQELRSYLVELIGLILDEKLRESMSHHRTLIASLERLDQLGSTVFLSLNYDILIDNSIGRMVSNTIPEYGVEFTPKPHQNEEPFGRSSLLLKLHGSLNWLFCPTCNALSLFPHHKAVSELPGAPHRFRCSNCRGLRVPIIVPPTFFKIMSNFYLQQIWKRAEEELKEARRIIFCGYSFPDADIHFKYLLKRAEVNRNSEPPSVFVVNRPNESSKENYQNAEEKVRYERFFCRKDLVHFTELSFQEFAADPCKVEDVGV
jgi:hypothetical protein